MRIRKYGLELKRLQRNDLEEVRLNRNSPHIRMRMEFQEEITPKMQLEWFEKIDTIYNNYFVISIDGKKIGLIHGKDTDFEKRCSEGGLFIWDENFVGTHIPMLASVILADLNFIINEFNFNYIKVKKDNLRALAYNRALGYRIREDLPCHPEFQMLAITKEEYLEWINKYRKYLGQLTGDTMPLQWSELDFSIYSKEEIDRLFLALPEFLSSKIKNHLELFPFAFPLK